MAKTLAQGNNLQALWQRKETKTTWTVIHSCIYLIWRSYLALCLWIVFFFCWRPLWYFNTRPQLSFKVLFIFHSLLGCTVECITILSALPLPPLNIVNLFHQQVCLSTAASRTAHTWHSPFCLSGVPPSECYWNISQPCLPNLCGFTFCCMLTELVVLSLSNYSKIYKIILYYTLEH